MQQTRKLSEITDPDCFFYYGQLDLDLETQSDLIQGLMQPSRSMFYNRSDGAGVPDWENHPNDLQLQIQLRYNISMYINRRNTLVGDGNFGMIDRRVAVSQFSILMEQVSEKLDITVMYIPFADYQQIKTIQTSIGMG